MAAYSSRREAALLAFAAEFETNSSRRFVIPSPDEIAARDPFQANGPMIFQPGTSSYRMQPYPSYSQYRASFPSTMATVQPGVQPGPSTAAHTDNKYYRYDDQANEKDAKQAKNPSSSTLGKRWNDAEIRYLILAWKDHYQSLKGKKRTKQAWDEICRDFNASCKEQCVSKGYRTAEQAKNKMKTLIDEYKNVVDNNNRSGRDRITCPYFEDIDEVLGCKDSQSINNVVNAGNKEAVVSSGEEQNSECGDISFEEEEGVEDQPEKKTRKRKGKQQEFGSGIGARSNGKPPTYVYPKQLKAVVRGIIPGELSDYKDPVGSM
ncbi:hypothetical protein QZH41_007523 [Actinostola sp. cb2023]|nr:hypothetical protein QZH41_007523 [Actinostola sp. cb2023]